MLASYDKRRNPLFDTKINRTDLKGASSISFSVFAKIEKNEFVSRKNISKICVVVDCSFGGIVDVI